jgi:hypothetical protein
MTRPRRELVSLSDTPYYHCVARCVRRAFLCGDDHVTGNNYTYRKAWVTERLKVLSGVFAVDICAYAVMSNHYHLVLHVDADRVAAWSDDQVLERWCQIFKGEQVIQRYLGGAKLSAGERIRVKTLVSRWRERLCSLSWYMRCLNEHIARMANAEDGCTGRFWEGRYRCQALLDETALVTAMTYVDLNPVRAGMAQDIETSDYTAVQARLGEIVAPEEASKNPRVPLMPFHADAADSREPAIPFELQDYLDLVDWTGRAVLPNKRGVVDADAPRLMGRLGIAPQEWLPTVTRLQARFELMIGSPDRLRAMAARYRRKFVRGLTAASRFYLAPST